MCPLRVVLDVVRSRGDTEETMDTMLARAREMTRHGAKGMVKFLGGRDPEERCEELWGQGKKEAEQCRRETTDREEACEYEDKLREVETKLKKG